MVLDNNTDAQITVSNASQAFDGGTVIVVDAITQGEIYTRVEDALKGIAEMDKAAIFEITAILQGQAVQPKVPVEMVFQIPDHLSADHLKLYYISTDGQRQEVPITVNKQANTVTATLSHFSTYVLVNTTAQQEDSAVPGTGDSQMIYLYAAALLVSAGLMACAGVVRKRRNK